MAKNYCVIPARGGSKRIKKKNLKDFLGKPILAYSIENAKNSKLFCEIYVSSDDDEILDFALKSGVKTLRRPSELSDDYAGTREVVMHFIKELNLKDSFVCCLYATAPLLKVETLQKAFKILDESCYTFPVVEYEYSPFRAFVIKDNKNKMLFKEHFTKRSQDLQKVYHDAGQFYIAKAKTWLHKENIFEDSQSLIVSALEAQDIDVLQDWEIAELKYKKLHNS